MVLATVGYLASSAMAWEVIAWGGSGAGWVQTAGNSIQIDQPGTYKFYATTGGSGGDLDEIRQISVNPEIAAGLVKVSIVRDPTTTVDHDPNGCTILGGIDLSNASDSEIPECRVQTNAATITGHKGDIDGA